MLNCDALCLLEVSRKADDDGGKSNRVNDGEKGDECSDCE